MKHDEQVENLEKALLERATHLAEGYVQRAEQQRDEIEREANERLRIREEREVLAARAEADRLYQQRVQASELRLQARLDKKRWEMIQHVKQMAYAAFEKQAADDKTYKPVLKALLHDAVEAIESDEVIIELNRQDRERVQGPWSDLLEGFADKTLSLSEQICECRGGVRAKDAGDRIRVDNTFEGRLQRLSEDVEQAILEKLFSKAVTTGELLHG